MKKTPVMLFDLGGVVIENTGFDALNAMLPVALDGAAIRERWLNSSVVRRFELGHLPASAFAEQFLEEWGITISPESFLDEFTSWPKGFYPGAEALLRRLRAEYHVSCLSNSNELHWARFGGFIDHFDRAFSSHLLGRIKPDADIFEDVMRELEVDPDRLYFFDDSLSNIQTAQRLGVRAFLVDGIRDVERVLEAECLL